MTFPGSPVCCPEMSIGVLASAPVILDMPIAHFGPLVNGKE
jgi:hypothetical protein